MINLKVTTLATVLALTSFGANALDLKGMKVGDPIDMAKIKAAFGDPGSFCVKTLFCEGVTVVGPTKMKYSVSCNVLGKDKCKIITSITLRFEPPYFDQVAPLFIAKFGAPAGDVIQQEQNAYGAQFTNRMIKWADGEVVLYMSKYVDANTAQINLGENAPARNGSL
jgi:hypothetical protein